MEQFKRAKVVLLPTKNEVNSLRGYSDRSLLFKYSKEYKIIPAEKGFTKNFHLHITSDDKIKEGDYGLHLNNQTIIQFTKVLLKECDLSLYKKIIATTDTSLTIEDNFNTDPDDAQWARIPLKLPQPSQQFIEKYIECYNKGNIITDVLVEYEEDRPYEDNEFVVFYDNVKINPKDNTITIKKIKDSWNREEHSLNLMNCVSELAAQFGHTPTSSEMKKWNDATNLWIEKNL